MLAKRFHNFLKQTDGAVTVDWVVLTALVVGLAVTAVGQISGAVAGVEQSIATSISTAN